MPNKLLSLSSGVAIIAWVAVLAATPAHAGFQWVAPGDGPATVAASSPSVTVAPSANASPEVISPVVITGDARAPSPSASVVVPGSSASAADLGASVKALVPPAAKPPVETGAPAAVAGAAPMPLAKDVGKSDLATATISVSPSANEPAPGSEIVQGFASQVPLALALRQVLPIGYSFSIDADVDRETLVSYKGGKPWSETLQAMLTAAGLVSQEHGKVVTVSRGAQAATQSAPVAEKSTVKNLEPPKAAAPVASVAPVSVPVAAPAQVLTPPANLVPLSGDPMPTSTVAPADGWSAERGSTLHKVLSDWCRRAGVELKWLAEYDYPLDASAQFSSGFEDAVRNLLSGFEGARPQPIGELHANPAVGQTVLVIQARGNSYSN